MIEGLYENYYRELVSWAQTMTGNRQTAQELVQEGFLRALQHEALLESMDEKRGRAWLYRTVKNLYVDRIRHTAREYLSDCLPEPFAENRDLAAVEWASLLQTLPDLDRQFFLLRYLEGYTSAQIGEMFSLPPGTVRSRLSSACKLLRKQMGGKEHE